MPTCAELPQMGCCDGDTTGASIQFVSMFIRAGLQTPNNVERLPVDVFSLAAGILGALPWPPAGFRIDCYTVGPMAFEAPTEPVLDFRGTSSDVGGGIGLLQGAAGHALIQLSQATPTGIQATCDGHMFKARLVQSVPGISCVQRFIGVGNAAPHNAACVLYAAPNIAPIHCVGLSGQTSLEVFPVNDSGWVNTGAAFSWASSGVVAALLGSDEVGFFPQCCNPAP